MIHLAVGLPSQGKTQWLMDYVSAHARANRFFVVDRAADWQADSIDKAGKRRWRVGFTRWTDGLSRFGAALLSRPTDNPQRPWYAEAPDSYDAALEWAKSLPATGVYIFGWPWEGDAVANLVRDVGNATYVDDEIDLVATQKGWQSNANALRDFAHRGRHLPNREGEVCTTHILGACRRVQSLHIDMISLADSVAVFKSQGAKTFERLVDENVLRPTCPRKCKEEHEHIDDVGDVREAPKYHFLQWRADGSRQWMQLKPL